MDEKTLMEIEAKATEALEARRAYEPAPRANGAWDRVTMSETDLADTMTPERVLALVAEVRRLRVATIEECAREIERVALRHDTVVCAALAKHLRKMKRRSDPLNVPLRWKRDEHGNLVPNEEPGATFAKRD